MSFLDTKSTYTPEDMIEITTKTVKLVYTCSCFDMLSKLLDSQLLLKINPFNETISIRCLHVKELNLKSSHSQLLNVFRNSA